MRRFWFSVGLAPAAFAGRRTVPPWPSLHRDSHEQRSVYNAKSVQLRHAARAFPWKRVDWPVGGAVGTQSAMNGTEA